MVLMRSDHSAVRAVLFDLDGTLLDSERNDILAMSRLFRDDLGLDLNEREIAAYIGISSREVLEQLAPDRVEELLAVWLGYQEELLADSRLFPGITETLLSLSESRLRLGVVTGQNKHELKVTRRHMGIEHLIEVWVSADDAPFSKPHPAPVQLALDRLGCAPDQAIMIGDTRFDMQAGRQAGTLIGVALWGVKDLDTLLNFQPDFIFENPQQVQNFFCA